MSLIQIMNNIITRLCFYTSLEAMRSQPHPLNREEGILPHVYDALICPNTPPPRVHRTISSAELTSGRVPPAGHASC